MKQQDQLRLKVRTLEASNKRLRKHLREARHYNQFPNFSSSMTNILSQQILNTPKNVDQQSMSVNNMLEKGMKYIIDRYEHDIKNLILFIDGKIKINSVFPFSSDSPKLFEELVNRIYKLKIEGNPKPAKANKAGGLNRLIQSYNQVTIQNSNKCRVILYLQQVIQRLHFQSQKDEVNNKVTKCLATSLGTQIHSSYKLSSINKFRAIVHSIRFCMRLSKNQKQTIKKIQTSNLKLIESPMLYGKLYRSYSNDFEYKQNQITIKRLLGSRKPQISLNRLLNLDVFHNRIVPRNIQIKLGIRGQLIRYQELVLQTQQIVRRLQSQIINISKQSQTVKLNLMRRIDQYKQKLKTPNKVTYQQRTKCKKISR